jgi:hypothetical protein
LVVAIRVCEPCWLDIRAYFAAQLACEACKVVLVGPYAALLVGE